MTTRFPSLLQPPVSFTRPAGTPDVDDDLLTFYHRALSLGATGLACEIHLSEDGEALVHTGPALRVGLRRRGLSTLPSARVPAAVPRLTHVYETCGTAFHLLADLADDAAAEVVTGVARAAGGDAEDRLWLGSADWRRARSWRQWSRSARLVQVTRLRAFDEGPERRAATLAAAGIDAISLRDTDWNAGLTTLFHRFGLLALAGPTPHRHRLDAVLAAGVDGVTSEAVEEMVAAVAAIPPID